jgi:hypothetical protein
MSMYNCVNRLMNVGFSYLDATELRRISMTLHRWHEKECGDEYGNAIERDEVTGKPYLTWQAMRTGIRQRYAIPDKERGALERLAKIMLRYPQFVSYIQGDPRGASLYIVDKSMLGTADIDSVYNRGIAVYR